MSSLIVISSRHKYTWQSNTPTTLYEEFCEVTMSDKEASLACRSIKQTALLFMLSKYSRKLEAMPSEAVILISFLLPLFYPFTDWPMRPQASIKYARTKGSYVPYMLHLMFDQSLLCYTIANKALCSFVLEIFL